MTKPSRNEESSKSPSLTEWLRRYRCKGEMQVSRYEGSHLVDRWTTPLSGEGAGSQQIESGRGTWQCETRVTAPPDREGAMDLEVCFKLIAGEAAQCNVGVAFGFENWSTENYVLVPGAVYNGNRFESRSIRYPPILRGADDIGADVPPIITDVPRLNLHEGLSRIQLLTGDAATPAVGFYAPESRRGFWLLTDQHTRLGDSGITVEESEDRKQATLSIAAPVSDRTSNTRCALRKRRAMTRARISSSGMR